jgi:16S rRNA processing protein RimM
MSRFERWAAFASSDAYAGRVTPSPEKSAAWTVLAHLLRPQGRKGELLAELFTDFPQRFDDRRRVYLAPPGFSGPVSQAREISVVRHWLPVGRNQGRIVFSFAGIDSIKIAEALAGLDVLIPEQERVELEDDEEFVSDLIGCTVFDGPIAIGVIASVDFPATPDRTRRLNDAAPLLNVRTEAGDEILIPYVQSFLIALDVEQKRMEMTLPAGLLDLNKQTS